MPENRRLKRERWRRWKKEWRSFWWGVNVDWREVRVGEILQTRVEVRWDFGVRGDDDDDDDEDGWSGE